MLTELLGPSRRPATIAVLSVQMIFLKGNKDLRRAGAEFIASPTAAAREADAASENAAYSRFSCPLLISLAVLRIHLMKSRTKG